MDIVSNNRLLTILHSKTESLQLTKSPEVPLSLSTAVAWHLHEALVQRQIVPDRVLPAFLVLLEVGKPGGDVGVYLAQGRPFLSTVLNGHGDQSDVAKRRLLTGRVVVATVPIPGPGRSRGPICDRGRRRGR